MKKEKIFKESKKFFTWIENNKDNIKNVKIILENKIIRVIYEKM